MFDTTSTSLGIGVTGTDHPSSNLYITGNAYVSSNIAVGGVLTMGTVNVVARHDLEAVTATGNITPLTVEFTNPTTSLVASGNVVVTGNVTADHFVGDGSNITGISSTLQAITDSGPGANVTSNTVQFSNATTSLTATSNIEVAGFVGSSGTGALTLPSGTTADQPTAVVGMIRFNETVGKLEFYMGTSWETIGGMNASQSAGSGSTTTSGGYKIHTFTGAGTFSVFSGGLIDYLIVAGGGAGATTDAGGGGAGGVVYGTMNIQAGNYSITIGAGGASVNTNDRAGLSGSNSTALGFTAIGGGGGGNDRASGQGPKTGGSGGGGGSRQSYNYWPGANGIQNSTQGYGYGNNGGDGVGEASSPASTRYSGGGGGAGEAGKDGSDSSDRGGGGDGIQWPSGSGTYYGGGGGGGHNNSGSGGQGGGGDGKDHGTTGSLQQGGINTGGGGGGGGGGHGRGGNGGTGIVIIRYLA
jgi:hypothetical protein